jgi:hypothetical protein
LIVLWQAKGSYQEHSHLGTGDRVIGAAKIPRLASQLNKEYSLTEVLSIYNGIPLRTSKNPPFMADSRFSKHNQFISGILDSHNAKFIATGGGTGEHVWLTLAPGAKLCQNSLKGFLGSRSIPTKNGNRSSRAASGNLSAK